MRKIHWLKHMKRALHGVLLWTLITGGHAFAQPVLGLPWKAGQIWHVLQSYHKSFGKDKHALDFKPDNPNDTGIVAPASGMAYALKSVDKTGTPCDDDNVKYQYLWNSPLQYVRIDLSDGSQVYLAHLSAYAHGLVVDGPGVPVGKGETVGIIGNSGCTWGTNGTVHLDLTLVKNKAAQPIPAFEGVVKSSSQYPATRTNMSLIKEEPGYVYRNHAGGYPVGDQYMSTNTPVRIGSLIRLQGTTTERPVYLVSVDETGNIFKRHVANENAMTLNKFSFSDVADVESSILAMYPTGQDINGRVTRDDLKEGELVRIAGDTVKVYVVSEGIRWYHLSRQLFCLNLV